MRRATIAAVIISLVGAAVAYAGFQMPDQAVLTPISIGWKEVLMFGGVGLIVVVWVAWAILKDQGQ